MGTSAAGAPPTIETPEGITMTVVENPAAVDADQLMAFVGRAVAEIGAT